MQIVFNGFLKNATPLLDDAVDHFYIRTIDCFDRTKEIINPSNYDYWIDFSSLADINFLKSFYQHYNQVTMNDNLEYQIKENLKNQISWYSSPELQKLSLLIDFEWKFNLFHWNKTFSIQEYMLHKDPVSLLNLNNYSQGTFVL